MKPSPRQPKKEPDTVHGIGFFQKGVCIRSGIAPIHFRYSIAINCGTVPAVPCCSSLHHGAVLNLYASGIGSQVSVVFFGVLVCVFDHADSDGQEHRREDRHSENEAVLQGEQESVG